MLVPLNNFAPDVDPTTPGVIVDCSNLLPTLKGWRAAPTPASLGMPALASTCRGLTVARKLDGTWRVFAGTGTALLEAVGSSWVDQSRVGGYSNPAEARWRFCQFGNITLAANRTDALQQSLGTTFADVATAPKAAIIETVAGFVMAFDVVDTAGTGFGDQPDGWWCSALRNQADWTPAIATQSANGRLLDTPGAIRAGRRLGGDIVAYKERSMYLGRYVGPPIIWAWTLIPGEIGALSHEAVVDIGTAHVFLGPDDFYLFDGTRPASIGASLREWFFARLDPSYQYKVQSLHDRKNAVVYWFYPVVGSGGTLTEWVAFHYKANKWGRGALSIEAASEYLNGAITYDNLGSRFATYDDLPAIAYDSPYWTVASALQSVVNTSHVLQALNGPAVDASLTTGELGDDRSFTTLTEVRPRFLKSPTTATLTHQVHDTLGDAITEPESSDLNAGKFDALWSARWHRLKVSTTGDMEITALRAEFTEDGTQ